MPKRKNRPKAKKPNTRGQEPKQRQITFRKILSVILKLWLGFFGILGTAITLYSIRPDVSVLPSATFDSSNSLTAPFVIYNPNIYNLRIVKVIIIPHNFRAKDLYGRSLTTAFPEIGVKFQRSLAPKRSMSFFIPLQLDNTDIKDIPPMLKQKVFTSGNMSITVEYELPIFHKSIKTKPFNFTPFQQPDGTYTWLSKWITRSSQRDSTKVLHSVG